MEKTDDCELVGALRWPEFRHSSIKAQPASGADANMRACGHSSPLRANTTTVTCQALRRSGPGLLPPSPSGRATVRRANKDTPAKNRLPTLHFENRVAILYLLTAVGQGGGMSKVLEH